jgi:hypothetical protein
MCKNFKEKGVCKYGDKCLFAHGEHELSRRETVQTTSTIAQISTPVKVEIEEPKIES